MYSSSSSENTPSRSDRSCMPGTLVEVPVFYDTSCKAETLFDVPVFYQFDSDSEEPESEVDLESNERHRRLQKSERVELSKPFNFVLPKYFAPLVDDDEDDLQILSVEDRTRLPLVQRLKGWIREMRRRSSGRLDIFYYHEKSGEKQFRSFRDVKRFIYLGFFPSAENKSKYLEQWVSDQANPQEEGAPSTSATPNTNWQVQISSSAVTDTNLQMQEEGKQQEKRPRLRTDIVELSEPFNFLLPTDYVSLVDDDEEIQKLSNGDVTWLPLAQRLKGWIRETRCRSSGRLDFFYYHKGSGDKQYRSFRDVKRYIYLGFFPSAENGNKYLDQWVFDQPNPKEEGAPAASAASNSTTTTQIQEELSSFD